MVITESDTILQEYYITRKYKSTIHEGAYIIKLRDAHDTARGTSGAKQGKSGRKNYCGVRATAALQSPWEDPLRTLISYSKINTV